MSLSSELMTLDSIGHSVEALRQHLVRDDLSVDEYRQLFWIFDQIFEAARIFKGIPNKVRMEHSGLKESSQQCLFSDTELDLLETNYVGLREEFRDIVNLSNLPIEDKYGKPYKAPSWLASPPVTIPGNASFEEVNEWLREWDRYLAVKRTLPITKSNVTSHRVFEVLKAWLMDIPPLKKRG